MSPIANKPAIEDVEHLARQAGELLSKYFYDLQETDIAVKHLGGLVTKADTDSENFLKAGLLDLLPGSAFLAEESGEEIGSNSRWIIDPLDGTSNFASGLPWFCISIALEQPIGSGKIDLGLVYAPLTKDCYSAVRGGGAFFNGKPMRVSPRKTMDRAMLATGFYYHKGEELRRAMEIFSRMQEQVLGVRRFGAAALDLALVAAGKFDGFWELGLSPWDMAAGLLLIEEAGGKATDYQGAPFKLERNDLIVSNGKLHQEILKTIQRPISG